MTKRRKRERVVRSPILEHDLKSRVSKAIKYGRRNAVGASNSLARAVRPRRAKGSQRFVRRKGKAGLLERAGARKRNKLGPLSLNQKICSVRLNSIRPSPENKKVYRPDFVDRDFRQLMNSIKKNGLLTPLCVTRDGYILSGHRRYFACKLLKAKTVDVRYIDMTHDDPRFMTLLVACNTQRRKSLDDVIRENIVEIDEETAYKRLQIHRRESSKIYVETVSIDGTKRRSRITRAKHAFLIAVQKIIEDNRKHWPLSDRQIHYLLLNKPPLIHARKPGSRYKNDLKSYRALVDLLTRARLTEKIPFDAIGDLTRPFRENRFYRDAGDYYEKEAKSFLNNYRRNLIQSQPNHIEIFVEKMTLQNVISPVASEYCIPFTAMRGYTSLPSRRSLFERFMLSGKERLILLVLADYDPDGQEIVQSLARSMRDDFELPEDRLKTVRVALNRAQVTELGLPPMMKAKKTSPRYREFRKRHGEDVWELEAVPAQKLIEILQSAIEQVIDIDLFNKEIAQEKKDAKVIHVKRETILKTISSINGAIGA